MRLLEGQKEVREVGIREIEAELKRVESALKGETKSRWIFGYRDGLAFALRRLRDGK